MWKSRYLRRRPLPRFRRRPMHSILRSQSVPALIPSAPITPPVAKYEMSSTHPEMQVMGLPVPEVAQNPAPAPAASTHSPISMTVPEVSRSTVLFGMKNVLKTGSLATIDAALQPVQEFPLG
ncbi:MAG: hypothetical protein MZV63_63535 [Marinilabiliales bacterium]|nr:hypothetical protein [Marinilabiliales bacterium]